MHQRGTRGARPVGLFVGSLVLAVATSASSGAAAPTPALVGVVSGSRLRAMLYDGGEGALSFRSWFDSELGVPCTFMRTRGGQMRCLPFPLAIYADASCTIPVWRDLGHRPPPPYVTAFVSQGGPAVAAYALGEPYNGAIQETSAGACVDRYVTSGSFYGTGAEIPAERLVAGAIRTVPIDSGALSVRTSEGADGSSWVTVEAIPRLARVARIDEWPPGTAYVGSGRLRVQSYVHGQGEVLGVMMLDNFFDAEADGPCHVEPFADGLRCVPRSVARSSVDGPYLDAACTTRLASSLRFGAGEPPSPVSAAFAMDADASVATAYTLGDVVTPETVYFNEPACHPSKAVARAVYRRLGAPAGDSQWAPVTARTE
jgi:hypothetical protein